MARSAQAGERARSECSKECNRSIATPARGSGDMRRRLAVDAAMLRSRGTTKFASLALAASAAILLLLAALHACSARPHRYYLNRQPHLGPVGGGGGVGGGNDDDEARNYGRQSVATGAPSYEQLKLEQEMRLAGAAPALNYRPAHQDQPARAQRRDDLDDELDDDDDGDQSAAASYKNEDNNGGGGQGQGAHDGYGDNDAEPDAAYEETPSEQEGQADLERFFDDHLGASDRDGMDKENLPSELVRALAAAPATPGSSGTDTERLLAAPSSSAAVLEPRLGPAAAQTARPIFKPLIETRYISLPESKSKLIITHQVSVGDPRAAPLEDIERGRASSGSNGAGDTRVVQSEQTDAERHGCERVSSGRRRPEAVSSQARALASNDNSAISLVEDANFEQVFVTNSTNGPFRIAALGGYDPEQDFNEAAAEIDDKQRLGHGSAAHNEQANGDGPAGPFSFSEPDSEPLYEDASETDEITFGQDEPYQTDLEAEMRQQEFDKVGQFLAATSRRLQHAAPRAESGAGSSEPPGEQRHSAYSAAVKRKHQHDLDEGAWVNDGVEDMDIPSQSHQDMILEKAARQAERAAAARAEEAHAGAEETAGSAEQAPPQRRSSGDDDSADDNDDGADTGGEGAHEEPAGGARAASTNDEDAEVSRRMPSADYLRNDLTEHDSGF